ncbi:hypothetical protein [Lysobacter gummosus]
MSTNLRTCDVRSRRFSSVMSQGSRLPALDSRASSSTRLIAISFSSR